MYRRLGRSWWADPIYSETLPVSSNLDAPEVVLLFLARCENTLCIRQENNESC